MVDTPGKAKRKSMGYNMVMENPEEKDKKEKNLLWIPITLIVIIVGLLTFVIFMRLFTLEDTWLCSDGEWVEHGRPSAPKPTFECKKADENNSKSLNLPNINPFSATHNAINLIPDENPIGPVQIKGFFKFLSPAVDLLADFGMKVCQWGRPKVEADNCSSIKVGFQEFFNK
jgi:hypothetical protein